MPAVPPTPSAAGPTGSTMTTAELLPDDFIPLPYTVVMGKGKSQNNYIGNKRLHILASSVLPKYAHAIDRTEKTEIISDLVNTFRRACPHAAFVKYQNGQWWSVGDDVAREKVSYVLRDLLHDSYKSSSKSKSARRRQNITNNQSKKKTVRFTYTPTTTAAVGNNPVVGEESYLLDWRQEVDRKNNKEYLQSLENTAVGDGDDDKKQGVAAANFYQTSNQNEVNSVGVFPSTSGDRGQTTDDDDHDHSLDSIFLSWEE